MAVTVARRRHRPNPSRAEVKAQAKAMGIIWEIGDDDDRPDGDHPDWEAVAVALDAWEGGGFRRLQAADFLPAGIELIKRGGVTVLTDLPPEPPLLAWLKGDIDSVFGVKTSYGGDPRVDLDDAGNFHWSDLDPVRASDKDDIRRHPENYVYLPRYLAFGDYDNSGSVERSNQRVFLEAFGARPGIYEIYGSHGSQAVGIRLSIEDADAEDEWVEELIRTLSGLEDYPVLDDEDMSNLEQEMFEEAYDNFGRTDFVRAIEKLLDLELTEEGDIGELFWRHAADHGVVEGGGVYFDIDKMADNVTVDDLDDIGAKYELGGSWADED